MECNLESLATKQSHRRVLFCLYFIIFFASAKASSDEGIEFDKEILKQLGVAESAADYFRHEAKFNPGVNSVELNINGINQGWLDIMFSQQGEPCFNPDFYRQSRIIPPPMALGCSDLRMHYPRAIVKLLPGISRMEIVLPANLLQTTESSSRHYETGGLAAILNYDVQMMHNPRTGNNLQLSTETGFNAGNWIFRSRQIANHTQGQQQWNRLYSYVQRTFIDNKTTLQMGEINLDAGLLSTPQIYGLQVVPESALATKEGNGVTVSGVAQTQARVEVRQHGALVYVTQVPPGPFTLTKIPIVSASADLQVTVIGIDQQSHHFSVPAASFSSQYVPRARGTYAGVGRSGPGGNKQQQNSWLGVLTDIRPLGDLSDITQSILLGSRYQSAGLAVNTDLIPQVFLAVKNVVSRDQLNDKQGVQWGSNIGVNLISSLKLNVSSRHQTCGFRHFQNSLRHENRTMRNKKSPREEGQGIKQQYTANISYNPRLLGGFSLGYIQSEFFSNQTERRLSLGWSKKLPYDINFNLNMDNSLINRSDKSIYANISIPFNSHMSLSSTVSQNRGVTQQRLALNHQVNNRMGYNLGVNKVAGKPGQTLNGNLRLLPKYAQLDVGYFQDNAQQRSYQLRASGGMVGHRSGITLSPYAIQDTFAIMVLPGISGAEIQTNSGPVWTDMRGYAVAPSLSPFNSSRLEVNTKKLARNIDIKNGLRQVDASRGAVFTHSFTANKTRRILLSIRLASGEYATAGSDITDKEDNYIGTVGNKGELFLNNGTEQPDLYIKEKGNVVCQLDYRLPAETGASVLYEEADARCI
ncbi:hypothetical protein AXW37_15600 [Yersinia ruckeri]|nr:fimbria/pilus outer membrane usher protein [Yersinia ruckeri]MCW6523508.1 fimbria/pilus outer membrane usher protein [Yersinia ruckeri]MDN0092154.1 fimbria/pilus outer membrane usher protein [Yersinia ruckeri]OIX47414.1 hypothetical protein AXW22_15440 [Yersinia ruckeri]OJB66454.1 hypothetical protein A9Q65_15300 [Yersinia ruckeri]OJB77788.1 hypothetical protein A9Q64_15335 [Yersinia ruckeri]